jgi:D-tyrosyl-tRNA(Tyr) deacylase
VKAVLQRVSRASVKVDEQLVGEVKASADRTPVGLMILLGVADGDTEEDSTYLAKKTAELRIFEDEGGKMNKSLLDINGSALVISQFTLLADWRKGRRPGFSRAARPEIGEKLYQHYVSQLKAQNVPVQTGVFGADMQVSLSNEGPVTIILDTQEPG